MLMATFFAPDLLLSWQQGVQAYQITAAVQAVVPQYGGLSRAVSRYKAVNIAWRDRGVALTSRNEQGGFPSIMRS